MRALASCLALVVALYAGVVSADDGGLGPDEVILKNGGMVRGTVVSVQPGEEVVIQVKGEDAPRKIPWAEVEDVDRGKHAQTEADDDVQPPGDDDDDDDDDADADPSDTPAPATPEEVRAQGPGLVYVKIDSDNEKVELHELLGTSVASTSQVTVIVGHTQLVCTYPCNKAVDGSRGQKFFFAGDGVTPSEAFTLNNRSGEVTAEVDAGSSAMRTGGYWMLYPGVGVMVAGIANIIIGSVTTTTIDGREEPLFPDGHLVGGILLGVGGGLVAGGIALIVAGGTDFELREGSSSSRPSARAARWWLGEF